MLDGNKLILYLLLVGRPKYILLSRFNSFSLPGAIPFTGKVLSITKDARNLSLDATIVCHFPISIGCADLISNWPPPRSNLRLQY